MGDRQARERPHAQGDHAPQGDHVATLHARPRAQGYQTYARPRATTPARSRSYIPRSHAPRATTAPVRPHAQGDYQTHAPQGDLGDHARPRATTQGDRYQTCPRSRSQGDHAPRATTPQGD